MTPFPSVLVENFLDFCISLPIDDLPIPSIIRLSLHYITLSSIIRPYPSIIRPYPSIIRPYPLIMRLPLDYKTTSLDYKTLSLDHKTLPLDYKTLSLDYKTLSLDYKILPLDYKTHQNSTGHLYWFRNQFTCFCCHHSFLHYKLAAI